eukprot:g9494.t1
MSTADLDDERAVLEVVEFSESDDEDFDYRAVEEDFSDEEDGQDEDLSAALATLRMQQEARTKDGASKRPGQEAGGKGGSIGGAGGDGSVETAVRTQVRPSVVDDFIRNFLIKVGLTRTLDSFNTEWYELQAKGRLGEEYTTKVPDIYLRNEELDEQVVALRQELTKMQAIAERAQGTWDKFRKERDFHRMHHKRVVQEKGRMATDLKRLKQHFKAYEPTLKELERKYQLAMKEKMLMKLERDRIKAKNEAIEAQMKAMQEERGIPEQDATPGSLPGSRTRPARGPGQPGGQALSPISAPPKNPQPTMGVKRKNDSKLPNEETVENPFLDLAFQPPTLERFALRKSFKGHLNSVSAVAFHPRKAIIATVSDDETWKVWSVPNCDLLMSGEGHRGWVSGVAFHPHGTMLATSAGDNTVKIWDFLQASCAATFTDHTQAVWGVSFHHSGDFLASCSMGHVDSVNAVAWQPFTNNLCTGSGDKTVSLWDARSGLCMQTFYGHTNAVNHVCCSLKGDMVASCDADGVVKMWDARMVAEIGTMEAGQHPLNSLCIDRSATRLAAASNDGTVKVFDTVSRNLVVELKGHEDAVQSVLFSPADDSLVSTSSDWPASVDEARVIILGGGLAGLRCAAQLVFNHGFSQDRVVLLEASPRIGGRIKTDTSFIEGFSLDIGAELIHGDETSLYRLAEEKGWEMEELISLAQGDGGPLPADSNDGFGLFYVGGERRMLAMDSKDPDFVHLNEYLGSLADLWPTIAEETKGKGEKSSSSVPAPAAVTDAVSAATAATTATVATTVVESTSDLVKARRPISVSLRDGLLGAGVGEAMMGIADAGYANTVGAALEDTSLMGTCFLEHEWDVDGDRTFVLKGSLGQVVDDLSAGLDSCIKTEWPVASVDYKTAGRVTVTCKDGRTEQGTHVVSALPLSVLQDGDVEFLPPLPEAKLSAFRCMGICSVVKVILKFDRPVLPPLLHGCICSESFIPEFWFRHVPDLPKGGYTMLAVGFAAGPPADAVSALEPEDAKRKALEQLDDMFRGRKWLKDGGCTGKGDWEGQEQAENRVGSKVGDDPKHSRTTGLCLETDDGNPGPDELRDNSLPDAEKRRHERNLTDERRPHEPDHGDGDRPDGAQQEGEAALLPSTAYTGGLVHDWVRDEPFVRGGYSYPSFGFDENTHADAAASVNGCLFFAGEHTNTPTGMTVHAAIDSGERAANEVFRAVQGDGSTT